MTYRTLESWLMAILVIVGIALTMYLGKPQEHPGAVAALGFGIILWFFVDMRHPDAPFGMLLGGAMGVIDWQDGLRFWYGVFALACLWCARSVQRHRQLREGDA